MPAQTVTWCGRLLSHDLQIGLDLWVWRPVTSHPHAVTSGSAPRLSASSVAPMAARLWVGVDRSSPTDAKGSSTCWVCFTRGLMDSRLCVRVRASASPDRLARVTTRTRNTPEDRMGTHTCAHVAGTMQALAKAGRAGTMGGCGVLF